MDNVENFDNICINNYDCDIIGVEKNSSNNIPKNKFTEVNGEVCIDYFLNTNGDNSKMNIMVDESSDEDVTFIRQISTPLLQSSSRLKMMDKRHYLRNRKKITKITTICFISSLILAFIAFVFLLFLPSKLLHGINKTVLGFFATSLLQEVVGCDNLSAEDIWIRNIPRSISEGAIRMVKINNDDVLDFVIPFGTNVIKSEISQFTCAIYYNGQKRCFGGLLALDGRTGELLWRYDSTGEMYALTCSEDLNKDGWIDCLGAGRAGTLAAVSGRDGSELWAFDKNPERSSIMNLYTSQFINDLDGDGVRDFVDMHGGDPVAKPNEMNRLIAKLIVFSGRTGRILATKSVSDSHESYYSPQILNAGDGVKNILYGTGGETFPGNLFVTNLQDLISTASDTPLGARTVYAGPKKGVMTPPVLVDLNGDGREDIVLCPFGDICLAIDGVLLTEIWRFESINNSETYASPAAGYYNEDSVPDIFVQLFVGLGYPVYFYGETIILDGRNGKIIKRLTRSNNVVSTSPLTLSIEGKGNDIFLYWLQLCRGHENEVDTTPFQNVAQYLLSRAQVCKLRFNTTTESLFLAHGRNLINQSADNNQIYNSENYFHTENHMTDNSTSLAHRYLLSHPELTKLHKLYERMMNTELQTDLTTKDLEDGDDKARKSFHDRLVQEQRHKSSIDLNDDSIHKSINFETPISDSNDNKDDSQYLKEIFRNIPGEPVSEEDIPLIRTKRHNGPHDSDGQQRLISTGTLAPPMFEVIHKDYSHSMDIVFSTYWSTSKEVVLQTSKEMECNKDWMNKEYQRFKSDSKFYHYDHDHYSEYGNRYCAKKYGRRAPRTKMEKGTAIFGVHDGQLTVYRKRLKCTCSKPLKSHQRCSRILPLHLQTWPAYLGLAGTAYWNSSYYHLHKL